MNCWIISLHPESEAVIELLASLKDEGIDGEIFSAVDGRKGFPELSENEQLSQEGAILKRRAEMTSGEVACYLSHIRIIRDAYKSGLDHALILEDDVVIEEGMGTVCREIIRLPESFEFVRLMGLKLVPRKIHQDLGASHRIVRPTEGLLGTQGYVINRSGMKKVLDAGSIINEPIDKFYDRFWAIDLKSYCVEPHLIWEKGEETSIAKSREKSRKSGFMEYMRWKLYKIYQTAFRAVYRLQRRGEFFPATIPPKSIGNTARLK